MGKGKKTKCIIWCNEKKWFNIEYLFHYCCCCFALILFVQNDFFGLQ
uniref:Uncharacterized protein n=1 Tax=Tetranychus urticae TaxID=32264 RepID=T1JYV1_TETUR